MPGTNFPTSLDTATQLPDVSATTQENAAGLYHDELHTNVDQAVLALETKLGIDSSTDHASVDWKLSDARTRLSTAETTLTTKADLVSGKVPSSQLPSYVDDVLEYANFAALPGTGETGKIYVTLDTNFEYRWSGSVYIRIVPSPGTTDDVPEGSTNLYFTGARARAAVPETGLPYLWTGFAAGDPGAGNFTFSGTTLYISSTGADGNNYGGLLALWYNGMREAIVLFRKLGAPGTYGVVQITSATAHTGYYEFTFTAIAGPAGASSVGDSFNLEVSYINPSLGTASSLDSDTDGTLAANSDARVATQKAGKTYSDTKAAKSANLSDLVSASTARTNLGLGGAAVLNVGTTAGTVAAGDDARFGAGGGGGSIFVYFP
jgi:hypothetical protein